MRFQISLLLPLTCALLYVVAALTVKRAAALGAGIWRTGFLSNWAIALLFLPLWFGSAEQPQPNLDYWQPAVTALLFFAGQAFTFWALSHGDVSVVTPVMGTKVILVALFSSLLRVGLVPWQWWVGAALSTAAIILLHQGSGAIRPRVGRTVLLAFCSATAFGLGDVLVQKWLPHWGVRQFFPPMFALVGLFSFSFIPFFKAPLRSMNAAMWRWVGAAALLLAINNAGVLWSIGLVGSATAVNIVYSLRGLFSVLLVWGIGHWFMSTEQHLDASVLRARLFGAGLMIAAIGLVLI
jgi:drug/metabolite transporter (DMT)-like permease